MAGAEMTDCRHIVYSNGRHEYQFDTNLHNPYGPAVISTDGRQDWYLHGKLHRTDGPAQIYPTGVLRWYQDGKLHREDGPAVLEPDGRKEWYCNGKPHRLDGPAVIDSYGCETWFINGVRLDLPPKSGVLSPDQPPKTNQTPTRMNAKEWSEHIKNAPANEIEQQLKDVERFLKSGTARVFESDDPLDEEVLEDLKTRGFCVVYSHSHDVHHYWFL